VAAREIQTGNVLYHFLQHDLDRADPELFRRLTAQLVSRLGIWLAPSVYSRLPLVVPYARRDSLSRGNRAACLPDQWGAPDDRGYFRDDNSLVKGIPRSLPVSSSFPLYHSRRLASGFVASHVWRTIASPEGAARNPFTYSFVPNLVWLPAQVAALSDREGSFVQHYLQRISLDIYRRCPVNAGHRGLIDKIWQLLPTPSKAGEERLPGIETLNYFHPTEAFFIRRQSMILRVAGAMASGVPTGKVVSTRYTEGIPGVATGARQELASFLRDYAAAAGVTP
jgi:hypothetical protein